jgi:hypothetical protein
MIGNGSKEETNGGDEIGQKDGEYRLSKAAVHEPEGRDGEEQGGGEEKSQKK